MGIFGGFLGSNPQMNPFLSKMHKNASKINKNPQSITSNFCLAMPRLSISTCLWQWHYRSHIRFSCSFYLWQGVAVGVVLNRSNRWAFFQIWRQVAKDGKGDGDTNGSERKGDDGDPTDNHQQPIWFLEFDICSHSILLSHLASVSLFVCCFLFAQMRCYIL